MGRPVSSQEKVDQQHGAFHNHPECFQQLANESAPVTPTCQVGLGQGFDLPVGLGGEEFSQRALGGAGTLISHNTRQPVREVRISIPVQALCSGLSP